MSINLNTMSLKDLKDLRKDVDKAISEFAERQKAEARAELEKKAKELGFSLEELVSGKQKRAKVAPKYRNPANASETWTGRGRRPRWVEAALAAGKSLDDFAI
jgi:DNA-binding protein H-NS